MQEAQPQNSFDRALLSDIGIFFYYFDPIILRHSGIWGAGEEPVLNKALKKVNTKNPFTLAGTASRIKIGMRKVDRY